MADFYLTRRAFIELDDIYRFSIERWGEHVARTYLNDLYEAFQYTADHPSTGKQRRHRSFPYYMAPAGKHFIVYEPYQDDIIIASVIHSKRDIEYLIKKLGPELADEIMQVRKIIEKKQSGKSF